MATFQIHQDSHEKENANVDEHQYHNQNIKGKRSILAILNNKSFVNEQGKAFVKQKLVNKRDNVEKYVNAATTFQQQQMEMASATLTTTEGRAEQVAKPFLVYEEKHIISKATLITPTSVAFNDKSFIDNPNQQPKVLIMKLNENQLTFDQNTKNATLTRNAFKTPIPVSENISLMSVEKLSSKYHSENLQLATNNSLLKKSPDDAVCLFEVDEYQQDILEYYKEVEKKHRPKYNYMKRQPDINNSMRTILVDWLVEVVEEYRLQTETLYLAVSYIDRFLSYMSVVRAKLQLVGTAAVFVAAKYEEIYPPDVGEFVFITDDTYTKAQILRMEQIILKILSFDLNVPSPLTFLNVFSVLHKMPKQVTILAAYLSELTLLEGEPYLQYLPSQISSAALALSRYMLKLPVWSSELKAITNYGLNDLKEIILQICRSHKSSLQIQQQAIQEKYNSSKYLRVASIKPVELDKEQLNYIIKEANLRNAP